MTETIQLALQHLGRGRPTKLVPKPLSAPLFAGAASRQLEADEALFLVGEPGDGCYRLEKGLLKVVITSLLGKDRILAILGPGAIVGELAIIDRGPRSASVFAVKHCELSFISRTAFEERRIHNPEINQSLINLLATRLRRTDEAMAATSFLTVKARLARALLQLAELAGEDDGAGRVVLRHTIGQSDLAAMAGVARENVSRVIGDWERCKVVTRSSGFYHLIDIETLERDMDS
jgi:CRP-like cAMP-binding protein